MSRGSRRTGGRRDKGKEEGERGLLSFLEDFNLRSQRARGERVRVGRGEKPRPPLLDREQMVARSRVFVTLQIQSFEVSGFEALCFARRCR